MSNIFQKLGKLLSKVPGAVRAVAGVVAEAVPVVRVLREFSPGVDRVCDLLEAEAEQGGVAVDDFLDRNVGTLQDMKGFFAEVKAWAIAGEAMCDKGIEVSQVTTPEIVDPGEALALGQAVDTFRARSVDLATVASPELEAKLLAIK